MELYLELLVFHSKIGLCSYAGQNSTPPPFIWLWSSCLSKQKLFFWLLLKDRLNTREPLLRKKFHIENADCVLCSDGVHESSKHLFFGCSFSKQCWSLVGFAWDLALHVIELIQVGKRKLYQKLFKEIMIIACWSIWLHRNKVIFNQGIASIST